MSLLNIALTASILILYAQAGSYSFRCMPYRGLNSFCFSDVYLPPNYTDRIQSFSMCPSDYYCPVIWTVENSPYLLGRQNATCTQKGYLGEKCSYAYQCLSNLCILGKCANKYQQIGENCTIFYQCDYGLKCYKPSGVNMGVCINGTGIPGEPCTDGANCSGNNICNSGVCTIPLTVNSGTVVTTKYACKSFTTIKNVCIDPPILQGAGANGLKPCNTSSDCTYMQGTEKKTADLLGKQCIKVSYSDTNQSYCELGEGDELFKKGLEDVFLNEILYI